MILSIKKILKIKTMAEKGREWMVADSFFDDLTKRKKTKRELEREAERERV